MRARLHDAREIGSRQAVDSPAGALGPSSPRELVRSSRCRQHQAGGTDRRGAACHAMLAGIEVDEQRAVAIGQERRRVAQRILERLQRLSAPFGTTITIEKGVGVIRLAPSSTN